MTTLFPSLPCLGLSTHFAPACAGCCTGQMHRILPKAVLSALPFRGADKPYADPVSVRGQDLHPCNVDSTLAAFCACTFGLSSPQSAQIWRMLRLQMHGSQRGSKAFAHFVRCALMQGAMQGASHPPSVTCSCRMQPLALQLIEVSCCLL